MHYAQYQYDSKSLTFVSTKAQVAFPAAHVDERDKRVDVRATAAASDYHTWLNHWQLLFVNKTYKHYCDIMHQSRWLNLEVGGNLVQPAVKPL